MFIVYRYNYKFFYKMYIKSSLIFSAGEVEKTCPSPPLSFEIAHAKLIVITTLYLSAVKHFLKFALFSIMYQKHKVHTKSTFKNYYFSIISTFSEFLICNLKQGFVMYKTIFRKFFFSLNFSESTELLLSFDFTALFKTVWHFYFNVKYCR